MSLDRTSVLKAFGIYCLHQIFLHVNHTYVKVLNIPVLVFSPNYTVTLHTAVLETQ